MKKLFNLISDAYMSLIDFLDSILGNWGRLIPDTMLRSLLITCFLYPTASFISWEANWVVLPFWWWWCGLNVIQVVWSMFKY